MKPILGYFKLRGWAGPIRLLLAYLEIDYEEILYQLPVPELNKPEQNHQCSTIENKELRDWKAEKYSLGLPFPNLPYWIEDKIKLTETKAILRHIARSRSPSLLGLTTEDKAKVNVLEEYLWTMWNSLCQICLKNDDEEIKNFLHEAKYKFHLLNRNFSEAWSVGSYVTVADFLLYEIVHHYNVFCGSLLEYSPALRNFMSRFESIPQLSSYLNSEKYIEGPCFSSKFKCKL